MKYLLKYIGISKCCSYLIAAEQKARSTYDNILRLVKDPEVADPIRFLRAREIVHYQRFGEALRSLQEQLDANNFYAFNPSFDAPASCTAPPGDVVPALEAPACRPDSCDTDNRCDSEQRGNRQGNRGYSRPPARGAYNSGRNQNHSCNNRNNCGKKF